MDTAEGGRPLLDSELPGRSKEVTSLVGDVGLMDVELFLLKNQLRRLLLEGERGDWPECTEWLSGIRRRSSSCSRVPFIGARMGTVESVDGLTSMHEAPWMLDLSLGGSP